MFTDANFKIEVGLTNDYIDYKEQFCWVNEVIHWGVFKLNCRGILRKLLMGHDIRHLCTDIKERKRFGDDYCGKREDNFMQTNLIMIDIDNSNLSFSETINLMSIKPSFAHTSDAYDEKWKVYHYHLFYILDEPITNKEEFAEIYHKIVNAVLPIDKEKDYWYKVDTNGDKVWFCLYGNPKPSAVSYCSNIIYSKNDF
jgi:hypothetical protein